MSKTITLRKLEPGESGFATDYYVSTYLAGPHLPHENSVNEGLVFREVSPIPEGYEVCDLADATKVLIGETWIEKMSGAFTCGGLQLWPFRIEGLGVLAIRPIPETEPTRGENVALRACASSAGCVILPKELIGKTIRWEVVKDGGK